MAPRMAEIRNAITRHTATLEQGNLVVRAAQAGAAVTELEEIRDELTRDMAASSRTAERRAARVHAEHELEKSRSRLSTA